MKTLFHHRFTKFDQNRYRYGDKKSTSRG